MIHVRRHGRWLVDRDALIETLREVGQALATDEVEARLRALRYARPRKRHQQICRHPEGLDALAQTVDIIAAKRVMGPLLSQRRRRRNNHHCAY
jgi:hypothetical protein